MLRDDHLGLAYVLFARCSLVVLRAMERAIFSVSSAAMDWSNVFEVLGKLATGAAALAGAWWAFVKWVRQDELFPRVEFEVSANFLGCQSNQVVTELVATLENKGQAPLRIKNFTFKLRGIDRSEPLVKGSAAIREQLLFSNVLAEGVFVPATWDYSFIYPGVKTEYNFVTTVPTSTAFVRMQGDFEYIGRRDRTHHAAKILRVPSFADRSAPNPDAVNAASHAP